MRIRWWSIAFGLPALVFAASTYYWSQQPPCKSFIDGPCENREAIFGPWFFAHWLSGLALAVVGVALVCRALVAWMRRRRAR